ncbi:DNA primase [Pseudomonas proteolytica]|uniref:DNA primase n=1 Tax=Pseudomonas proteolytica TaxID=219574 RepID=UPI0014739198|nr:DNA primase [Pseudomonas proteolytica]NMZ14652.1 DNA primase [Pseudomonas proteolytica]
MAKFIRFNDAFLEKLRDQISLPELIGREIKLKRSGRSFTALCPFHDEKGASFTVSSERNTYRCYGCPAKGDAIQWMRKRFHLSFYDAVVKLAEDYRVELPAADVDEPGDKEKRQRLGSYYQVLKEAARIYQNGLAKSPRARSYLHDSRGLKEETIQEFGLGVVTKGVIGLLSKSGEEVLIGAGLAARNDTGIYDRFRQRVMFPIHNESGNLIGFAGRTLLANPGKAPKYLNSPETEIFHKGKELYGLFQAKAAIRKAGLAIAVEGYIDVISAHQEGDKRVVAPMGTAVTKDQIRRLFVHTDRIVFAFDGDRAGRRAALSASVVLLEEIKDGQSAQFLFLPEGEDPDTFIRTHGLAGWEAALAAARPLSTFLCDYVAHRLDRSVPELQVTAANKAKAILARTTKALMFRHAMRLKFEDLVGVPLS